jgi:hypothetical protein
MAENKAMAVGDLPQRVRLRKSHRPELVGAQASCVVQVLAVLGDPGLRRDEVHELNHVDVSPGPGRSTELMLMLCSSLANFENKFGELKTGLINGAGDDD